jgi:uncharacterized membrane protein YhaH (DUF805 family)
MSFGQAVTSYFQNYVTFTGRAPRSAYWWVFLFNLIIAVVAAVCDQVLGIAYTMAGPTGVMSLGYGPIYTIYLLAVLLPSIALSVRRLHDRDMSGWWFLLVFVPLIGALILLVWFCLPGTPGDNRFGPNPLASKPA